MGLIASIALGAALVFAGLWWLWGGRWSWLPESRFHRAVTVPTRLVVGIVHLVLGYHLIAWQVPGEQRPLQVPPTAWVWLVLGCGAAIGGSVAIDRLERRAGQDPMRSVRENDREIEG